MPHGHGGAGENPEESRVFADSVLKAGAPLPLVTGAGRDRALAWATYRATAPVVRADLNVTHDPGRWQDRQWESLPAERTEGRVHATLPKGTRVYYFNLLDDRGCVVSTEHVEVPAGIPD